MRSLLSFTALAALLLGAQALDPKALTLFNQPADVWPTYNGDYSGRRFSDLTRSTSRTSIAEDRVDLPDHQRRPAARRRRPDDQVDAAAGERHSVLHDSRPRFRDQRAYRRTALAVRLRGSGRASGRPARRRDVRQLALLPDSGWLVHLAERQRRQGAVAEEGCRREAAVLHHDGAADREESRDGRRGRRRDGCARLSGIARPGNRRTAMELVERRRRRWAIRAPRRGRIRKRWITAAE